MRAFIMSSPETDSLSQERRVSVTEPITLGLTDLERQLKLEADAIDDGALLHARSRKYQVATGAKPGRDLVGNALQSLTESILAEQLTLKTSERRKLPKYATALLSIVAEKQALITLGTILNAVCRSEFDEGLAPGVTSVAYEIGQRCRLERIFDRLRRRQVDVARELLSRNRGRNAWRRAEELARKLDDLDDWSRNYRSFHLGAKLIALAVAFAHFDGQPVFEYQTDRTRYAKTTQRVALTPAASDWIASHEATLASLPSPAYMPMVMPPLPRKSLSGGAYLLTPVNLLKRKANRRAEQILANSDLSSVYSAVNALQNTAYRINKDVYQLQRKAWDAGHLLFGLRTHSFERLPPRLPDDADPEHIRKRKQERAGTFKLNIQIKGLQKITSIRLSTCERLLDEPRLYFPCQLDHRSRAYPVPQLLNPQSDDAGRSLLEFAEGKPLGERGAYWLAIHLANCYWKKNKVSFDKRLTWVHEHEKEILDFAANPLRSHPFWDEADKPWMFLAACIEWKGYREQGPDFISHLPVSMDGSCNGYQHLSAIGRDPIGGRATNLVPAFEPADIYQEVADYVRSLLRKVIEMGGEHVDEARQLLGLIDRNIVKHATMTTPYGVTRGTIYRQLLEATPVKFCKEPAKCARYLAKVLEECIPAIAVEAGNIMKWLRNVARTLAKANRGLVWTTPAGFRVVHEVRKQKPLRVTTADGTLVIYLEDETRRIDWRKQADGIVAHLVHSLDAAHMMLTINRLHAAGVRHFAMVHDSFGVHAADIDLLNRVLREEFVQIYSQPVLQNFLNELKEANPDVEFPELPQTGNLDIRQVMESSYFFA
jgi:DNA-directed RNA polymerase